MKNIYDIYESFQSKIIRMIKDDAERQLGMTFNKFTQKFYGQYIAWDEITDADVEILKDVDQEDIEKMFKAIRGDRNTYKGSMGRKPVDNNVFIFGYHNDRLKVMYAPSWKFMTVFSKSSYSTDWRNTRYDKPGEQANALAGCDEIYLVHISDKRVSDKVADRGGRQVDMVPVPDAKDRALKHNRQGVLGEDPGGLEIMLNRYYTADEAGVFTRWCARIVDENMKRYKELKAKMKFQKNNSTAEIDKLVGDCMTRFAKITENVGKDLKKYKEKSYTFAKLVKLITGSAQAGGGGKHAYGYITNSILLTYQRYLDTVSSLSTGNANGYSEMYMRDKTTYEQDIKKLCQTANELFKELGV